MKINRKKMEIAMARACMSIADLAESTEMSRATIRNVLIGRGTKPVTIGKIAKALKVDVSAITEYGE